LKEVPRTRPTSRALDAIHQALATFAALPDSPNAHELREQYLAIEVTAREWARVPPSPEDRDLLIRKVLALHVAITKLRRTTGNPT
jgi:hypothetical protein